MQLIHQANPTSNLPSPTTCESMQATTAMNEDATKSTPATSRPDPSPTSMAENVKADIFSRTCLELN